MVSCMSVRGVGGGTQASASKRCVRVCQRTRVCVCACAGSESYTHTHTHTRTRTRTHTHTHTHTCLISLVFMTSTGQLMIGPKLPDTIPVNTLCQGKSWPPEREGEKEREKERDKEREWREREGRER